MRNRKLRPRLAVLGLVVVGGVAAGAVALASSGEQGQFSGRTVVVSNRVLTPANSGPNGDGNSGDLLLSLPGFGDFTITGCKFVNGVTNANFSFRNTADIPVDLIGVSAFNRQPTFAPGESAVVEFISGLGRPSFNEQFLLTGGTGTERRVASLQFGFVFTAADQCSFSVQATAQAAHPLGNRAG